MADKRSDAPSGGRRLCFVSDSSTDEHGCADWGKHTAIYMATYFFPGRIDRHYFIQSPYSGHACSQHVRNLQPEPLGRPAVVWDRFILRRVSRLFAVDWSAASPIGGHPAVYPDPDRPHAHVGIYVSA